tara:strand:+ start:528 stop:920 length:393 start_codon:yes stop_codon:yes gene_type:complete
MLAVFALLAAMSAPACDVKLYKQYIEYDKMFVHYAAWQTWKWDNMYDTDAITSDDGIYGHRYDRREWLWLEFLDEAPFFALDDDAESEVFELKMSQIHVLRKQHVSEERILKYVCASQEDLMAYEDYLIY